MTELNRIELPPNFGVNVLNLEKMKGGKLRELITRILNPFNVNSRIQFRSAIDTGVGVEIAETSQRFVSKGSYCAFIHAGVSDKVHIFSNSGSFVLRLSSTVTCVGFVSDRVLVTGTVCGDIEVWYITLSDPIYEAKCVYRYSCGSASTFPVLACSDDESRVFQVVLNKGRCMLLFDTVACISGSADESAVAPVIVDLLQQRPIIDGGCMNGFLATLSDNSVCITDTNSHRSFSFDVPSPLRCMWASDIGHLFVVTENEELLDCAWSDGLIGVSSFPKTITSKPSSIQSTGLRVNPDCVDLKGSKLVHLDEGSLAVFSRRQSPNEERHYVSSLISEFHLDKQVPCRLNPGDEAIDVRICDPQNACVAVRDMQGNIRPLYLAI
jgi:hypothetical protein